MWGGRISIRGIWLANKKVFDNLIMPGDLSKDRFINLLFADAAELECVYTDPDLMEQLIEEWSISQQYEWTKIYNVTQLEYDPIQNYNRTETETIDDTGSGHTASSSKGKRTDNGEQKQNVTGFNTDTYSPNKQDVTDLESNSESEGEADATSESNRDRKMHAYGNIGVTTSQTMIQQEIEVSKLNLYNLMVQGFINKFCVQIY